MDHLPPLFPTRPACKCGQLGCPQCDPDWQRPHVRRPDIYGRNARTYRAPGGGTYTYIGNLPRRKRGSRRK